VLLVNVPSLPYLAFGDSDAVAAGLSVAAFGYPFGRDVEVAKAAIAPGLVPEVSTTAGTISALRKDDSGRPSRLQFSNSINPGNSGGPLVDRDGFAVGVIQSRLTEGSGIGFAIPINEVKDFLEAHSLDQLMPARRLRLGPFQNAEAKGIGLRLPEGVVDSSPFPSRFETDAQATGIALRIDRVLSPWNPRQIEQTLVETRVFEYFSAPSRESQVSPRLAKDSRLLLGRATDTTNGDQEIRMDYAILDLGSEKLVARYVGPLERMAFNEHVLRQSLASLDGQRYVAGDLRAVENLQWPAMQAANGQRVLPVPLGWIVTVTGPSSCPGVPPPGAVASASPPNDFSITLRAAIWPAGNVVPEAAASACAPVRSSQGDASYVAHADSLGVSYVMEGIFIPVSSGQIVRLEVVSPEQKSTLGRGLLALWIKKITE
jgi:hypothetical protein